MYVLDEQRGMDFGIICIDIYKTLWYARVGGNRSARFCWERADMVMTRDEFIAILTPDRARWVYETVQGGLADYANPENYSAAARLDHTKSIRAAIRNGHMIGRGKRALVANPGLGIRHVRNG